MTTSPATSLAGDPEITDALVREHGLRPEEYERILSILGRTPTFAELGVFSALWSEHCAYKHSKPILKTFPTEGPQVVQGPGENAGVLRVGDGWAVAFKMESHNHPTAVEPYEGAATGVGGILRDVFTMGARPVALLNSLRFGPMSEPRNRYLLSGAVRGIGDYGNCMGIPTTGGEVQFSSSYSGNPLVNAMCVGVLRESELIRAIASGVGNELIAVGARTGRDGIHGASFASEELTEESDAKRPQVQVGDPFTEKLLMEASLELIGSGHIVGIQDMGAAGLTSSSAEMAARGGMGVEIDTALCPVREDDMTPYEILLSESQERMLVVGKKGRFEEIRAITEKWELEAALIGSVTDDGMFRVTHHGETVVEIPGRDLVDQAPVYSPPARESDAAIQRRDATPDRPDLEITEALKGLLDTPTLASKRWVFEQYDSTVRASTVRGPGADGGMTRIPDTTIGIASSADCNGRYVALDPYEGGKAAVAEAARNVAAVGAKPLGITNCLNFGSPEKPEVFYQFREACRGIGDACTALDTPVTGGNVSFYNESPRGPIDPTPIIGMIGVTPDVTRTPQPYFNEPGESIIVLGSTDGHLGGSAYWTYVLDAMVGPPPPVDLTRERSLIDVLLSAIADGIVRCVRDVSDGGLALALAEACIGGPYAKRQLGAEVDLADLQQSLSDHETLFGEDHSRAIVTTQAGQEQAVLDLAARNGIPARVVGKVTGHDTPMHISVVGGKINLETAEMRELYMNAIPRRMTEPVTAGATD